MEEGSYFLCFVVISNPGCLRKSLSLDTAFPARYSLQVSGTIEVLEDRKAINSAFVEALGLGDIREGRKSCKTRIELWIRQSGRVNGMKSHVVMTDVKPGLNGECLSCGILGSDSAPWIFFACVTS